ncbi:hypothetical protein [Haliangium sp.]|uniref:hypothetical protein n=1 Tax=Haliangium sp. TaxID=2663208 RepID=UPI003D0CA470
MELLSEMLRDVDLAVAASAPYERVVDLLDLVEASFGASEAAIGIAARRFSFALAYDRPCDEVARHMAALLVLEKDLLRRVDIVCAAHATHPEVSADFALEVDFVRDMPACRARDVARGLLARASAQRVMK